MIEDGEVTRSHVALQTLQLAWTWSAKRKEQNNMLKFRKIH
jgi:hypothetical protein